MENKKTETKLTRISPFLNMKFGIYTSENLHVQGQQLERDKSGIFVSKGVHFQFIRQIKNQWDFKHLPKDSKYFGLLPLFLSSNKSRDLSFIKRDWKLG